jgi:hypothetical protein
MAWLCVGFHTAEKLTKIYSKKYTKNRPRSLWNADFVE